MARKWLPRKWAKRVPMGHAEPWSGPRRGLTLHTEGVDRGKTLGDVTWLAKYVNTVNGGIAYHLIWQPWTGQWIQMVPFDRAARSMKGGAVDARGLSANRSGLNIQVCVAGFGYDDWTRTPMKNAWVFAELMDRYKIPQRTRAKWGRNAGRSRKAWSAGGIQGHCHGPHDDHVDGATSEAAVKRLMREARRQQKARR